MARSVGARLQEVRGRIETLARELNKEMARLVAVSKLMPNEAIMEAYKADQRHFGENYVQEICDKAPQLPSDIKWHFIGHLQSNKAKMLVQGVPNLFIVESVDSSKLANQLDKACDAVKRDLLEVMLQVNTSKEESKSGCEAEEAAAIASHIVNNCKRLKLTGLMTIGKLGDPNPEPYFKKLVECRSTIAKELGVEESSLLLSMGMSGDYELAIRMGSNNVRVGSTIFGERPPKEKTGGQEPAGPAVSGGKAEQAAGRDGTVLAAEGSWLQQTTAWIFRNPLSAASCLALAAACAFQLRRLKLA